MAEAFAAVSGGGLMAGGSLSEAQQREKGAAGRRLRKTRQAPERAAEIGAAAATQRIFHFAHNVYYGKYQMVSGRGIPGDLIGDRSHPARKWRGLRQWPNLSGDRPIFCCQTGHAGEFGRIGRHE